MNQGGEERFVGVCDAGGHSLTLRMTPSGESVAYLTTRLLRVDVTRYMGVNSPDAMEVRFMPPESSDTPAGAVFDVVGIPWEATRLESNPLDGASKEPESR